MPATGWIGRAGALLLSMVLLLPSGAAAQAADCQIARANGSVTVERGGDRGAAMAGLTLNRADILVTGAGSGATLVCTDGLRIVLGADTRIGLDRLMAPASGSSWPGVDLFRGLMGVARPQGQGGGFAIRTPSAVAAVRSTEWSVEVVDAATSAFVREGRVSIFASNRTAVLEAGEGVDVTAEGIAGETKNWGATRIDGVIERLGPDW